MRIQSIRVSRRAALRSLAAVAVLSAVLAAPFSRANAQQEIDPSFSNTILPTIDLPVLNLEQTADGLKGVPDSVPAGRYLVNYAGVDVIGYLLFAQYPADLPMDEAIAEESARIRRREYAAAGNPDTAASMIARRALS